MRVGRTLNVLRPTCSRIRLLRGLVPGILAAVVAQLCRYLDGRGPVLADERGVTSFDSSRTSSVWLSYRSKCPDVTYLQRLPRARRARWRLSTRS